MGPTALLRLVMVVTPDTPWSEVVKRVLATHSIRPFPPSLPLPCVTVRHHTSTGLYWTSHTWLLLGKLFLHLLHDLCWFTLVLRGKNHLSITWCNFNMYHISSSVRSQIQKCIRHCLMAVFSFFGSSLYSKTPNNLVPHNNVGRTSVLTVAKMSALTSRDSTEVFEIWLSCTKKWNFLQMEFLIWINAVTQQFQTIFLTFCHPNFTFKF